MKTKTLYTPLYQDREAMAAVPNNRWAYAKLRSDKCDGLRDIDCESYEEAKEIIDEVIAKFKPKGYDYTETTMAGMIGVSVEVNTSVQEAMEVMRWKITKKEVTYFGTVDEGNCW